MFEVGPDGGLVRPGAVLKRFHVGLHLGRTLLLDASDGVVLHPRAVQKLQGGNVCHLDAIGGVWHPVPIGGAV